MLLRLLNMLNRWFDKPELAKLLLRITLGVLTLFHGVHKIGDGGLDFINAKFTAFGIPTFIGYGIYYAEIVAPILIILGILTRFHALVLFSSMLVAWLVHNHTLIGSLNPGNGSWAVEPIVFFTMVSLVVALLGAGKYSLAGRSKWS